MFNEMKSGWNQRVGRWLAVAVILTVATRGFCSDHALSSSAGSPLTQMAWDSDHKQIAPKDEQLTADFSFSFTNISNAGIVIAEVKTSCSCTLAKLPVQPWPIAPHTNGQITGP